MKYSKIDIRNTVRNLIDYFKMQNEVPSPKEIVEVWSKIKEGVEKKNTCGNYFCSCFYRVYMVGN